MKTIKRWGVDVSTVSGVSVHERGCVLHGAEQRIRISIN